MRFSAHADGGDYIAMPRPLPAEGLIGVDQGGKGAREAPGCLRVAQFLSDVPKTRGSDAGRRLTRRKRLARLMSIRPKGVRKKSKDPASIVPPSAP